VVDARYFSPFKICPAWQDAPSDDNHSDITSQENRPSTLDAEEADGNDLKKKDGTRKSNFHAVKKGKRDGSPQPNLAIQSHCTHCSPAFFRDEFRPVGYNNPCCTAAYDCSRQRPNWGITVTVY